MEGYQISIRHWPLCYFLLTSFKRFPFKMGFCVFLGFVFRSPGEEAGTRTEIQSPLSLASTPFMVGGSPWCLWTHSPSGSPIICWIFLEMFMQNKEHHRPRPPPLPAPVPTPPTAKPLKWQMCRPPERLHVAPAVDIFKVNIGNDSMGIMFLNSSLPKLYQGSQINSRMTSDLGRRWVLKWKSQVTLKRNSLWSPEHIAKPPITQLRLGFWLSGVISWQIILIP